MKVYIHTDLEGISGIDNADMVPHESKHYRASCEKLMLDLNAAVAGAFDGGADHVTVLDSHGGGGNFILDMLDKRAENDTKPNKKWWAMMDKSYDGTMFIGAHGMAGTINGFLDHTQSSKSWYNYYINGRKYGELGQWAVVAGAFDIPMLMVSGDEAACAEARAFFNPVETAAVKQGVGRNKAIALPEDEARKRIREAARKAIGLVGKAKPLKPLCPMEIVLEFYRSDYCDAHAAKEGVERLDARAIRKVTSDPLQILFR
jgi:D-amino peptidase